MELKTVGLTKKFGSKIAVDDLNITLANGVYGLLGAKWRRKNNANAAALQYPKSHFRKNTVEWEKCCWAG